MLFESQMLDSPSTIQKKIDDKIKPLILSSVESPLLKPTTEKQKLKLNSAQLIKDLQTNSPISKRSDEEEKFNKSVEDLHKNIGQQNDDSDDEHSENFNEGHEIIFSTHKSTKSSKRNSISNDYINEEIYKRNISNWDELPLIPLTTDHPHLLMSIISYIYCSLLPFPLPTCPNHDLL